MSKSSLSKTFAEYTTIHGVPDLERTKYCRKLIWLIVFLAAFGGCTYEVCQVCYQYIKSPLITTYDVKSVGNLTVPAIEICPTNTISAAKMRKKRVHPAYMMKALTFLAPRGQELINEAVASMMTNDSHVTVPYIYERNTQYWLQVAAGKAGSLAKALEALETMRLTVSADGNNDLYGLTVTQLYLVSICQLNEGIKTGLVFPMYRKKSPLSPNATPGEKISYLECDPMAMQKMYSEALHGQLAACMEILLITSNNLTRLRGALPGILSMTESAKKESQLTQKYQECLEMYITTDRLGLELDFLLSTSSAAATELSQLKEEKGKLQQALQSLIKQFEAQFGASLPLPSADLALNDQILLIEQLAIILEPTEAHYQSVISKFNNDLDPVDVEYFLAETAYSIDEVFIGCFMGVNQLYCNNITKPVFDLEFGWCFSVNVNTDQMAAGMGFRALLHLNTSDYFEGQPNIGDGAIIRISHEHDPVSYKGIRIMPGTEATIEMKPTKFSLNDHPSYGSCNKDMERMVTLTPYSDMTCRYECTMQYMVFLCGCRLPFFARDFIQPEWKERGCATLNESTCLEIVIGHMQNPAEAAPTLSKCYASCKPGCEYWDYDTSVTTNRFPSEGLSQVLKHYDPDVKSDEWKKNKIFFHATFNALQYVNVVQFPATTPDGFISQIGGNMGLFLGASLISIYQILDIIISWVLNKLGLCDDEADLRVRSASRSGSNSYDGYDGSTENHGANSLAPVGSYYSDYGYEKPPRAVYVA